MRRCRVSVIWSSGQVRIVRIVLVAFAACVGCVWKRRSYCDICCATGLIRLISFFDSDFDGFGFNLQQGHFIGKVDEDSPAKWAELKEHDMILEVNFVPISNENHKQVVQRIKAVPNETHLLVIGQKEYAWYEQRKLIIRANQPNVMHCKTPVPRPAHRLGDNSATLNGGENDENASELANASTASSPSATHSKEAASNGVSPSASTNTSLEHQSDPMAADRQTDSPLADEILKELESKENHVEEVANKLKSTKLQVKISAFFDFVLINTLFCCCGVFDYVKFERSWREILARDTLVYAVV